MGHISEHTTSTHPNTLDKDIGQTLVQDVQKQCIELIERGYRNYLSDSDKMFSFDETVITAGLCGHIKKIIEIIDLPFILSVESPEHTAAIEKGLIHPSKAKRFDILFIHFQSKPRKQISIEAKLLSETNTTSRNATFLINEYVEDAGMGKFIKGIYENPGFGFMLGYILNGKTENVVTKINLKVVSFYSDNEKLTKYKDHYKSSYSLRNEQKELNHIFLDFQSELSKKK